MTKKKTGVITRRYSRSNTIDRKSLSQRDYLTVALTTNNIIENSCLLQEYFVYLGINKDRKIKVMIRINKDYLIGELLELIAHEQLNGREFPEMPGERIEAIAESILWEWNELDDAESLLEDIIKNNLEDNIRFA